MRSLPPPGEGNSDALVAVLDPDIMLRDAACAVPDRALTFTRLSPHGRPALVNGAAGVVVVPRGRPFAVMGFTVTDGKIVEIDVLSDPLRLSELELSGLD